MNSSIFQVSSTASQAQTAALFDSQLSHTLCTSHVLTIAPDSSRLQLHDFITLQLAMVKATYCCFFDISECLGMADSESYYHALQNSISTLKCLIEELKQAFKHLQTIAVISVH